MKRLVVGLSILAIVFSLPRFFEVTTVFECTQPMAFANKIVELANSTIEGDGGNETEIIVEQKVEEEDCLAYVQRTGLPQVKYD